MYPRNRNNTTLSLYPTVRTEILNDVCTVASSITNYPEEKLLKILLYVLKYFSVKTKQSILKSAIKFLKNSERLEIFENSLPTVFIIEK